MKCCKCGKVLDPSIDEKGVISSSCNKIECFECAGVEIDEPWLLSA